MFGFFFLNSSPLYVHYIWSPSFAHDGNTVNKIAWMAARIFIRRGHRSPCVSCLLETTACFWRLVLTCVQWAKCRHGKHSSSDPRAGWCIYQIPMCDNTAESMWWKIHCKNPEEADCDGHSLEIICKNIYFLPRIEVLTMIHMCPSVPGSPAEMDWGSLQAKKAGKTLLGRERWTAPARRLLLHECEYDQQMGWSLPLITYECFFLCFFLLPSYTWLCWRHVIL